MTKEEREKAINKIMGYLATYLSVEQYAEAERIIKELRQDTVSRESYEHEFFLRKELDLKVTRLERQIAEQELCEDCVSRKRLMDNYNGVETPVGYRKVVDLEVIKNMPSVIPTTKWIPVSERMPNPGEYNGDVDRHYLVQNEYDDMLVARYTKKECWEQIFQIGEIKEKIVAWQPLPEAYKVESEE